MEIRINSIHFDATAQLQDFVTKKLAKLDQYNEGILKAEVFLKVIKPETNNNKHVEIKITVPKEEMFAEKVADSFEEAVDLAVEALRRQVKKHKEKVKGN